MKFKKIMATGFALLTAAQLSLAKPNMAAAQEAKQQETAQTIDKKVEQEQSKEEEKKPLVELGYNALENALVRDTAVGEFSLRNRLLVNMNLNVGPLYLGVGGLDEIVNLNPSMFYGDNTIFAGLQGSKLALAFQTKADSKGIYSKKYGVRYIMGDSGWVDAGIDPKTKSANITGYYALPLGKGWMLELYSDNDFAKGAKPGFYSEIQVDKELAAKLSVFFRMELNNAKIKEGKYMVGLAKAF